MQVIVDFQHLNGLGMYLTEAQKADLYAELATGAESASCTAYIQLASPIDLRPRVRAAVGADLYRKAASNLRSVILDLCWDENKLASGVSPQVNSTVTTFDLIPDGQLGITKDQLSKQTLKVGGNAGPDVNAQGGTVLDWGSGLGVLQQLSIQEPTVIHSDSSSTAHMFEKFSAWDIDQAGSGGEYTVQAGFGWTNGVSL
ncbi:Trehalase [Ceratobasidium theobromae]|uniref:alpha,alpha-trehalase n=1 Tax=Ceratobasidium theobromae TaxID=1582974 RepID=A0A5N5Q9F9_9AGAM|nr:Trehalase [Ceratobasidium theobromae]